MVNGGGGEGPQLACNYMSNGVGSTRSLVTKCL
jgi:hypothetical protein